MRGSGTGKSKVRGVMDPQLWHKVAAISGSPLSFSIYLYIILIHTFF